MKLVTIYKQNFDKTKKFVRQKIGTKKFGSAQTKNYYTQQYYKAQLILNGVGKKGVDKKAWMRTTKVGWVATPPSPYPHSIPHTIATTIVSYYKTTTHCPTLCSFPPIVDKKIVGVCAKKARYLRVLGAKKRVVI